MNYEFDYKKGTFTLFDLEVGKDFSNQLLSDSGYVSTVTHYGATCSRYLDNNAVLISYNNKVSVLYLRDKESGDYWNIGGFPSLNKIDDYKCVHGQNFTVISSSRNGISASISYFLDKNATREIWKVSVKNKSKKDRKIDLFAATCFDLGGFSQPFYYNMPTTSVTEFIKEINGVYCENKNPYKPHERCNGFIISDSKISHFEGYYEGFTGAVGTMTKPYVLENSLDLGDNCSTVRDRGGILQNDLELKAGEEKTVYYVLGLSESKDELKNLAGNGLKEYCEKIYAETLNDTPYSSLAVECPEQRINRVLNFWAEHQVRYCMVGKKAVRDNSQLAMAILNCDVKKAKETINECIVHQYKDGHCALLWYPIVEKTIYSDPSCWLVYAICEYVKESGAISYLNEEFEYIDGEKESVYEHLKRAAEWFTNKDNYGKNGLPKIFHADWNDALNIPDDDAESVLTAMLISKALLEIERLAEYIGDNAYAEKIKDERDKLVKTVNEKAYNGDYYVRAFSKFGVVGDKTCKYGKIYVNPQSWAILSETCPKERIKSLLESVDKMETEEGVPMCYPPYGEYDETVGRMSGMLAGVYENGGIYNHAGCFKVMSDCKLGLGDRAVNTFLKILPDGKNNPSSKTTAEPYVFTNCYLKNPAVDMKVGFTWQTGTSAWGLMCLYEGILGIRREYDGLTIKPCFPKSWKEIKAKRLYRGSELVIEYRRADENPYLIIDGERVEGNKIKPFSDGKTHKVTVYY